MFSGRRFNWVKILYHSHAPVQKSMSAITEFQWWSNYSNGKALHRNTVLRDLQFSSDYVIEPTFGSISTAII